MSKAPGKQSMTKKEFNIPVGTSIKLEACNDDSGRMYQASVIGYVKQKSLLITIPHCDGIPFSPAESEEYLIRYADETNGHAFTTKVLRLCSEPFPYVHLDFPEGVQGALVRTAPRIQVKMPVILLSAGDEHGQKRSVAMIDISTEGARLVAFERLGNIGDRFSIEMMAPGVDNETERYILPVTIRYIREEAKSGSRNHRSVHHGVEFIDLTESVQRFVKKFVSDQIAQHREIS